MIVRVLQKFIVAHFVQSSLYGALFLHLHFIKFGREFLLLTAQSNILLLNSRKVTPVGNYVYNTVSAYASGFLLVLTSDNYVQVIKPG